VTEWFLSCEVKDFLKSSHGYLWHCHGESDRLSLSGLVRLLSTFCMVTVIKGDGDLDCRLRCSCMLSGKGGRCAHMAFAAYLHGHDSKHFEEMVEQTRKKPKKNLDRSAPLDLRKVSFNEKSIPAEECWKCLFQRCSNVYERYFKNGSVNKMQGKHGIETSPVKDKVTKQAEGQKTREETLMDIGCSLTDSEWSIQFSALREIKKLGVTWDEANSHRIGKNVGVITKKGEGTFKALAHSICKKWTEEKALKKRRLNEPLKSPQQNEEKQPSGSQG